MSTLRRSLVLLGLLLLPVRAHAQSLFTFEEFADGFVLSNEYAGMQFTGASILRAGGSLNEFSFPPRSGFNVATARQATIQIDFADVLQSFEAYFTYSAPLQLQAFDALGNPLGTVTSQFSANFVDVAPGLANELVTVNVSGIRRVRISAGDGGFVMDDMRLGRAATVPEPSTALLLITGLGLLAAVGRFRRGLSA